MLRKNFFTAAEISAIVDDFRHAGLTDEEVAIMAFAQKITLHETDINEGDISELRKFGLSDEEILDIVLACAARNFFSKTLDSLGAEPDEIYREMEPELLAELPTGRPFS